MSIIMHSRWRLEHGSVSARSSVSVTAVQASSPETQQRSTTPMTVCCFPVSTMSSPSHGDDQYNHENPEHSTTRVCWNQKQASMHERSIPPTSSLNPRGFTISYKTLRNATELKKAIRWRVSTRNAVLKLRPVPNLHKSSVHYATILPAFSLSTYWFGCI